MNSIKRVIIWGLRTQHHTHRYIHKGFYNSGTRMGLNVLWLDDFLENNDLIKETDLIITVGFASKNLIIKKDAFYCLHNADEHFEMVKVLFGTSKLICLQVYTNNLSRDLFKISSCTYFDPDNRTLYQPWGTDIAKSDFSDYSDFRFNNFSFFVGSVWNNELNQGNSNEIIVLKKALFANKICFLNSRPKSEFIHKKLINYSRIAPAIAGSWQVENGYLPCRMFKNIANGALGASNVLEFSEILEDYCVTNTKDIFEIVDVLLSIGKPEAKIILRNQQNLILKHLYEEKINNIKRIFSES